MRTKRFAILAAMIVTTAASAQLDPAARPYPQGDRFPLGLYSVHAGDGLEEVAEAGWNFGHRYSFEPTYLDAAAAAGMFSLAHIDVVEDDADGTKTTALIADMATRESVLAGRRGRQDQETLRPHARVGPAQAAQLHVQPQSP